MLNHYNLSNRENIFAVKTALKKLIRGLFFNNRHFIAANMSPAVTSPSTLPPHSFQRERLLFSACGRETELVAGFLRSVLAKAVEEALGSLVRLA